MNQALSLALAVTLASGCLGSLYGRELEERARRAIEALHLPPAAAAIVKAECVDDPGRDATPDHRCFMTESAAGSLMEIRSMLTDGAKHPGVVELASLLGRAASDRAQVNHRLWLDAIDWSSSRQRTSADAGYAGDDALSIVTRLSGALGVDVQLRRLAETLVARGKADAVATSRSLVVEVSVLTELAIEPYGSLVEYGAAINTAQRAFKHAEVERRFDDDVPQAVSRDVLAPQ